MPYHSEAFFGYGQQQGSTPGTVHDATGAVAHWPFNNTLAEAITGGAGYDVTLGYPNYTALNPANPSSARFMSTVEREPGVVSVNAALKLNAAVTVAGWFCIQDDAVASPKVELWSCMVTGSTSVSNAFWGIRVDQVDMKVRGYWRTGAGVDQSVASALAITLGTWYHIAFTRSADSTTAKLYLNGALDNTVTGLSAHTGGGSVTQIVSGHNQAGAKTMTAVASPILFASEYSAAQVNALYESTLG